MNQLQNIAQIAAMMALELPNYGKMKLCTTLRKTEYISIWAVEFAENIDGKYDWEAVLHGEVEYKPLSLFIGKVDGWEMAIIDFMFYKIQTLKANNS